MAQRRTVWNPAFIRACVEQALQVLQSSGAESPVCRLLEQSADYLECCRAGDCKRYRDSLKSEITRFRHKQRIKPWEYWLLEAAKSLLHPAPGCKHQAAIFLRSAIGEYEESLGGANPGLRESWIEWYQQHALDVPAYLERDKA